MNGVDLGLNLVAALCGVFGTLISPMFMVIVIIGIGGLLVFILGCILPLFWFSYVILLTFLGGLLVVFVYISCLCPNEPTPWVHPEYIGNFLFFTTSVWGWLWYRGLDWQRQIDEGFLSGSEVRYLVKMYYEGVEVLVVLLVVYLLLVLLVVVDLRGIEEGALKVSYGEKFFEGKYLIDHG